MRSQSSVRPAALPARLLTGGVGLALLLIASPVLGQTQTWTNGTSNFLWGDSGNWNSAVPGSAETAAFGATGVGTIDLGATTRTISTLSVTTGAYTFSNGTLDLNTISPFNSGLTTVSARVTDQGGTGLTLNQSSGDSTGLTISGQVAIASNSATALRVAGTTSRNGTFTLGSTTLANSVTGGVTLDAVLNGGTTFQGNWTIGGDLRLVRSTSNAAAATLNGTLSIGGNLVNAMANANAGGQITIGSSSSVSVTGDLRVMNAAGTNGTGITINKALTALGGDVQVYHGTLNLNVTNPIPSTTKAFLLGDPTNTTPTLTSTISINTNAITLNNPVTVQSGNDAQAILTSGATGTNSANKVTYAGTITLNKNLFVDPSNTANAIIDLSGKVTGTGGLVINNAARSGTVWLSNATNDYSGGTTVLRGLLQVNAAGAIGGSGRNLTVASAATVALGYTPGSFQTDLLDRIVSTATGTVALNASTSENLDFSSAGNNFTALSLGAVGTVSYTGTLTPNGSTYRVGGGGGTLTVNPATHDAGKSLVLFGSGTGGTVDFAAAGRTFDRITFSNGTTQNGSLTASAYIADNTAAATVSANLLASGTAGLTKFGSATLTLSGANTYTGGTTVAGGSLALQFNATNAAGVVSSNALTLGSGTLSLLGGNTAIANTQSFASGTTLGGMAGVSLTKNTATTVMLNLGTLTRNNRSYLNVTTPASTVVTASHPLDASGALLGTWASVGTGTTLSYAASTSATTGTISAYTAATTATAADLSNVTSATTNYQYSAATTLAGNQTGNTLRYTGAATTTALGTSSLRLNGLMHAGSGKLTILGTAGSPGLVTGADEVLNIVTNTQSIDISSVISGSGGLTFGGPSAGTLTLTGLNTYTGKTTIVSGTLVLSGSGVLQNAGVASGLGMPTGADATIDVHNSVILSVFNAQSTNRTINLAGAGPGTVTLRFNNNDTIHTLGAVTATGAGAKTFDIFAGSNSGDRQEVTFNGSIGNGSDGSPLSLRITYQTQTGSSSVVNLVAGGTFTGPISLVKGANVTHSYLVIGGRLTSAGGNNNFTSTPGTGQLNGGDYAGNISLDTTTTLFYNSDSSQTLSGVLSGAGAVHKAAAGLLTLSGTNTYTGVTTLTGGTLSVAALGNGGAAGNLGAATSAAANLVFNGGTLRYTGAGETSDRGFTINAGRTATLDVTTGTVGLAGATGTATNGALTKTGAGTLALTGANTFTGATLISEGTLQLGAGGTAGSLAPTSALTNNGTLAFNRSNTLTQGIDFAAAISGFGAVRQAGPGTTLLSGTNTYLGSTTVAAGTLAIGAAGTINVSSDVVVSGGTFRYDNATTALTPPLAFSGTGGTVAGVGRIGSALVISSGNTISPGNSPGILGTANLTWATGGNYNWQMWDALLAAGTGFDQLEITGSLAVESGFNLNLWSLFTINPDVNGEAFFDNAENQYWVIATTTAGLVGAENLATTNIFTTARNGSGGFANALAAGASFGLVQGGSLDGTTSNDVVLVYTVPEPATAVLLLGGALAGLLAARLRTGRSARGHCGG